MGELMTRNLQVNPRFAQPYWAGTHWYKSFDFLIPQETGHESKIDERGTWFYEAVTSDRGHGQPEAGRRAGLHDHQARQRRQFTARRQDLPAARAGATCRWASSGR